MIAISSQEWRMIKSQFQICCSKTEKETLTRFNSILFDFYLFSTGFKSHDMFMFQINWFVLILLLRHNRRIHFIHISSSVWWVLEREVARRINKQYVVQLLKVNKIIWKNNIKFLHRHEMRRAIRRTYKYDSYANFSKNKQ